MARFSVVGILAAVLVLAACGEALRWADLPVDQQHLYTFDHFVQEHRREYSAKDLVLRKRIVEENLATIVKHNRQQPAPSYTMGVNHFTDLSSKEFKQRLGFNKKLSREHAHRNAKPAPLHLLNAPVETLPLSVDWRQKGIISDVKDQGGCGSCWAFGSTEMIESYAAMTTSPPTLMTLSPQQLVACAGNPDNCGGVGGCMGSIPELAFDYVSNFGMTTEWIMPYTSHAGTTCSPTCECTYENRTAAVTVDGYIKLPENDYGAVMNALATVGPLAINVEADTWQHYSSGIFPASGCGVDGNVDIDHVVQLVGYGVVGVGTNYWIVRNSWTPLWGERGYIRLQRDTANPCFDDTTPLDGTGCAKGPHPSPAKVTVCGTCGITYDVSYPTGAKIVL
eukprot:m.94894 g.94894  ORF g.94894 m.94894 type:complete len:394 (+) comp15431_c0_seq1:40-1221(+)